MEQRLARYNDAVRSGVRKTRTLNAFTIAGIAASIAGSFVFPPAGVAATFIALGGFMADRALKNPPVLPGDKAAAILYDARKHFGWQPR